ncbi:MAG: hypothetical protein WAW31_10720 [Smithella sp.]
MGLHILFVLISHAIDGDMDNYVEQYRSMLLLQRQITRSKRIQETGSSDATRLQ